MLLAFALKLRCGIGCEGDLNNSFVKNDLTPAILQIGQLRRRAAQRVDGLLSLLRGNARLRTQGQVGRFILRQILGRPFITLAKFL